MIINIKDCDFNNDYFHFTNKSNIDSILNNGLIPSIGVASKIVNDSANVSISKGRKGIMGIINSFLYKFSSELRTSEIPEEYKKYFLGFVDFQSDGTISQDAACRAMIRKLKDEVYFRVKVSEEQLKQAKFGGLTGYDVKLPTMIDKSNLDLIVDSNNKVLSAYDVAEYVYERAKDINVFRIMHSDFFYMFELEQEHDGDKKHNEDEER